MSARRVLFIAVLLAAGPGLASVAGSASAGSNPGGELVAPFVVTTEEDVERILDLANVGPGDFVIDLGSGDGRIVIGAAQRGARGRGVELDPYLVAEATANAAAAGVADRVSFVHGDIFEAELGAATVVTMYLMPEVNLRLRPKLLTELRPGSRVVSNSFDLGAWRPDWHVPARSSGGILAWIVPAAIGGDWLLELEEEGEERFELEVEQQFQQITLTLTGQGEILRIDSATLSGDEVQFAAGGALADYRFSGRAAAGEMGGTVRIERANGTREARWRAVRR